MNRAVQPSYLLEVGWVLIIPIQLRQLPGIPVVFGPHPYPVEVGVQLGPEDVHPFLGETLRDKQDNL